MLLEPPDQPESELDFSVLHSRIQQVKTATAAISEEEAFRSDIAKHFMNSTLLPILNVPDIYRMLQNPKFVSALTDLLGQFAHGSYVMGKTAYRKSNPNE